MSVDDTAIVGLSEPSSALEDPRLRFFLENQHLIREWASIESEVRGAVVEILLGTRVDLAGRIAASGQDIRLGDGVAGENQQVVPLYRPSWPRAEGEPKVAVALGWDQKVDPASASAPYVGVLASHRFPEDKLLEERLRAAAKKTVVAPGRYILGAYWVVYRPLRAGPDWWRDVAAWRRSIVDGVMAGWNDLGPLVDQHVPTAAARESGAVS